MDDAAPRYWAGGNRANSRCPRAVGSRPLPATPDATTIPRSAFHSSAPTNSAPSFLGWAMESGRTATSNCETRSNATARGAVGDVTTHDLVPAFEQAIQARGGELRSRNTTRREREGEVVYLCRVSLGCCLQRRSTHLPRQTRHAAPAIYANRPIGSPILDRLGPNQGQCVRRGT